MGLVSDRRNVHNDHCGFAAAGLQLYEGTNTPRQLSDVNGVINLTERYTPWGDALDTYGTGNFAFGYFGGVLDAATGLLYVGNGQYYNPATGRFLTRDARPNSTNPYVPWDPTGAIIGPLGVAALFFSKRRKGSKWVTLFVLLLVVGTVGMALSACNVTNPTGQPINVTVTQPQGSPIATVFWQTPTATATLIITPPAPIETLTPTCTPTPTPIPTTDEDYKRLIADRFGITLSNDTGAWVTSHIHIVYSALSNIDTAVGGLLKTLLGGPKSFLRDWDATGYSGTTYTNQINFHFGNRLPHQLIYHEMGHLLNNALRQRFTYALDHGGVYDENNNWVMGRDDVTETYVRDNWLGYKEQILNDPSGFTVSALMHPAGENDFDGTGPTAIEDWGDLFANYVVGNIDLNVPAGRARYKFVVDHLFSGLDSTRKCNFEGC